MPPSEGSENMGEGAYRSIIRMILAYQFKPGDVLLETEILVSPLPIWEDEWEHPETASNPRLLENIRREGVAL